MAQKNQGCCKQTTNNCVSQREHFNYLRNNSCGIWGAFSWGNNDAPIQDQRINLKDQYQSMRNPQQQYGYQQDIRKQQFNDQTKKGNRRVSFDDTNVPRNQQNAFQQNPTYASKGKNIVIQEQSKRPASAFQRKSKIEKDEQSQKLKNEQNMLKVKNYIQQLKPYTRGMSNTRFQDYFGKAAPQCYGRENTNQPIGGIIYGNHLKTFNVNPHVYTNRPQYYQTHTTAINYGKRAKVCQDEKWKKLAKQLTKKLGLKQKNETLIEGKEVVYVDVDDNNKYQVLRENHEFQKANKQQIHNRQLEYKKDKHQQYLDDINQYYAKKQQKIAENLSTRQTLDQSAVGSALSPEEYEAKLNQQTIYRYHDKNGNVRLAADRHGMTCFVDMNFPENQAAYVEELKNRMPIFPIRVEGEDKNLDAIRKQNCKKGHEQVYPSHYLLRNCEQPQVLKMLSNKAGVKLGGGKSSNQGKIVTGGNTRKAGVNSPVGVNANKSFVSTNYSQNQQGQTSFNQGGQGQFQGQQKTRAGAQDRRGYVENNQRNWGERGRESKYDQQLRANKSQIIDRAWGNSQLADELACSMNKTCCVQEHLPHNEMNPQCYKNASGGVGKIPYAR